MDIPKGFYAEPRFRAASPDFEKLRGVTDLTLDTPGVALALALDYYKVEAFARAKDRDSACGPAAHPDVRYFPITREELISRGITLDDLACGCSVDHADFAFVLDPLFERMLARLFDGQSQAVRRSDTSEILTIARARYKVYATWKGDWLNFSVDGYSAFEETDGALMERTIRQLNERFALYLSVQRPRSKMS